MKDGRLLLENQANSSRQGPLAEGLTLKQRKLRLGKHKQSDRVHLNDPFTRRNINRTKNKSAAELFTV